MKSYHFNGEGEGPHILFTGRIHGNEPCGEIALEKIRTELGNGKRTLKKGSITIIPCCNHQAALQMIRYVDANLNRLFTDDLLAKNNDTHEASLVPQIMSYIDQCDIYVDLHSFTEHMPPLVICLDEDNTLSHELATHAGITRIWCYSPAMDNLVKGIAISYAKQQGKPNILIECGQHNDNHSVDVAYRSILNILSHYGMIETDLPEDIHHEYMIVRNGLKHEAGQKLIFPLVDRDVIMKGDPVFETEDGTIIHADTEGLLLMRNENTPVGEDYAYICKVYDDWP